MGFIKIEVGGEAQRAVATPFHALDDAPVWPAPLRALGWDAAVGAYHERPSLPAVGEGVWLINPATTAVTAYAAGEVPLDDAAAVPLVPGLNLIAYPYLGTPAVESLSLDSAALTQAEAAGSPAPVLIPGQAYWYRHDGPTPLLWLATRPHANPFTANAQAPQIVGLEVLEDGKSVRLSLHAHHPAPAVLSVFYQDLQPDTLFNPLSGWQLATQGLIPAPDGTTHWEDRGGAQRASPPEVFGRVYVVVALAPGEKADGPWSLGQRGHGWGDASAHAQETTSANPSNKSDPDVVSAPPTVSGILYVNAVQGDDRCDGHGRLRMGDRGPKRTIGAALRAVQAAPRGSVTRIEAAGGRYPERVEIPRGIMLTGAGRVDLTP